MLACESCREIVVAFLVAAEIPVDICLFISTQVVNVLYLIAVDESKSVWYIKVSFTV